MSTSEQVQVRKPSKFPKELQAICKEVAKWTHKELEGLDEVTRYHYNPDHPEDGISVETKYSDTDIRITFLETNEVIINGERISYADPDFKEIFRTVLVERLKIVTTSTLEQLRQCKEYLNKIESQCKNYLDGHEHTPDCEWHKDWHACNCGAFDRNNKWSQ